MELPVELRAANISVKTCPTTNAYTGKSAECPCATGHCAAATACNFQARSGQVSRQHAPSRSSSKARFPMTLVRARRSIAPNACRTPRVQERKRLLIRGLCPLAPCTQSSTQCPVGHAYRRLAFAHLAMSIICLPRPRTLLHAAARA